MNYHLLISAILIASSSQAVAQLAIPNIQGCTAAHLPDGTPVPVRQRSGPSQFWAHANWDPDGWPAITYGPKYFQLPALMQVFTSSHECGHLVLRTSDEFAANCFALENGPFDDDDKQDIAAFHQQIGPIGQQYGGSGAAFWAITIGHCPNAVP